MPEPLSQQGEPLPTGAHEWYWGNGHPCCVNCGAMARCEDQRKVNRMDVESREDRDRAEQRADELGRVLRAVLALTSSTDGRLLVPNLQAREMMIRACEEWEHSHA